MTNRIYGSIYEDVCREYALHESFSKIAEKHGILESEVRKIIVELRTAGVDIACRFIFKITGYSRPALNLLPDEVSRLNTIVRINRKIKRSKRRIKALNKDIKVLKRKAKILKMPKRKKPSFACA